VHLHRELLGALDDALDPRRFVRIHRSAIVNIDVVVELRQDAHGADVAVPGIGRRFASEGASERGSSAARATDLGVP
jgi:two-component system LytT family response regulator